MNQQELRTAFGHPNVKAWYMMMRRGESSLTDAAYTMVNGRPPFTDFSKHPYEGLKTTEGGRAAGASQFIPTTWGELQEEYGFPDFSPDSQDLGYVGCLVKRHALDDVIEGRFWEALRKCHAEWPSLPGGIEQNQTAERCRDTYLQYGGTISDETQPPAPIEDRSTTQEKPVGALALLPMIAQFIPQIMSLIKPNSASTVKDAQTAQTILNIATQAAGVLMPGQTATATQVGAAVDAMQADPALAKKVQEAVVTHPEVIGLLEIGGGVKEARAYGQAVQIADKPFWYNPTFWISVGFFPMMYMITYAVLFTVAPDAKATPEMMEKLMWYQRIGFDPNTRSGLVNLIVGFVFGGIVGVWFGTSWGSLRKTELAASGKEI